MKRIIAFLLAVMLVASIAPAAFAAEQDTTTTLTTTVPGASYVFSIPKDTKIEYNALDTSIGYLEVTQSSGFAVGKDLEITIEYDALINADGSSTIPYEVRAAAASDLEATGPASSHTYGSLKSSGSIFTFKGQKEGTVKRLASQPSTSTSPYYGDLGVVIAASAWGKALAGEHTSTITFTAKVVQE